MSEAMKAAIQQAVDSAVREFAEAKIWELVGKYLTERRRMQCLQLAREATELLPAEGRADRIVEAAESFEFFIKHGIKGIRWTANEAGDYQPLTTPP